MSIRKLEKLKTEYENIKASEGLKERIGHMMKRRRMFKNMMNAAASVAVVFGLFVGVLNTVPAFAEEMAGIAGMAHVVRVLTFGRYKVDDGGFMADVVTPKIEGLLDKALQDKINNDFKENANHVIAAFERDYKEIKKEFPDAHMGVEYNYQTLTDNDDILAIDVYLFTAAGSSSTKHEFYTIDKKTGELLTLPSLFKENAAYVNILSEYIVSEMKRQIAAEENMFWVEGTEFTEAFTKIKPNQNFYINGGGELVICFDKYEVAPGSSGCPEFVIPGEIVKDILK